MSHNQQFQDKANILLTKITNLTSSSPKMTHNIENSTLNNNSLAELYKFQYEVQTNDEQSKNKIKLLQDEIKKIQLYLQEQNNSRLMLNEKFLEFYNKIDKIMKKTFISIRKKFCQKQKKLQDKIDLILRQDKKILQNKLNYNNDITDKINIIQKKIIVIHQDIKQMKNNRLELENKIYKQFMQQLKDLNIIFQRDCHIRQKKQIELISNLKQIYKKRNLQLEQEQIQRQKNQKIFINITQQLVNRIIQM